MHQIVCQLGLRPRLRCRGSLQRFPDPLAGFYGPTSKGRGRDEKRKEGREGTKGRKRKRRGGTGWRMGEGRGQGQPQAKAWPQNYFPGAGVVESAYWTSY